MDANHMLLYLRAVSMHTPRVLLHTATLPREIAEIDWPVCSAGAAGTGSLSGSSSSADRKSLRKCLGSVSGEVSPESAPF